MENLTPLKVAWSGHVFSTVAESTVAEQSNSDGIKSELSEADTVTEHKSEYGSGAEIRNNEERQREKLKVPSNKKLLRRPMRNDGARV